MGDVRARATPRVREALARDGLDAALVCGTRVHGLRGPGHVPVGLPDRPPLRVRAAPARGRAVDRLPVRGALRRRARHELDRGQVFVDRPGEWLADRLRRESASASTASTTSMTVRDFAALQDKVGARPVGRRVRPRAGREERGRARVGPRERPDQHGRLLGVPRGLRAGRRPPPRCWRRPRSSSSSGAAAG